MSTLPQADVNLNESDEFVVTATYEGKMDQRRKQRIYAALERCDLWMPAVPSSGFSYPDVNWTSNEDGTETDVEIYVKGHERATRLASELRACGLLVSIAVP